MQSKLLEWHCGMGFAIELAEKPHACDGEKSKALTGTGWDLLHVRILTDVCDACKKQSPHRDRMGSGSATFSAKVRLAS